MELRIQKVRGRREEVCEEGRRGRQRGKEGTGGEGTEVRGRSEEDCGRLGGEEVSEEVSERGRMEEEDRS